MDKGKKGWEGKDRGLEGEVGSYLYLAKFLEGCMYVSHPSADVRCDVINYTSNVTVIHLSGQPTILV